MMHSCSVIIASDFPFEFLRKPKFYGFQRLMLQSCNKSSLIIGVLSVLNMIIFHLLNYTCLPISTNDDNMLETNIALVPVS